VLTFAGADPTSGAGLQADLLTLASMGCHPLSVVTAITTQDTCGVSGVLVTSARLVEAQANAVLADIEVAAFKIGMIGSADNARAIARVLKAHPGIPVVLDPVLASGRGDELAGNTTRAALLKHLMPLATVITPNSVEARALAGAGADEPLEAVARALLAAGARHVLITGTHEPGPTVQNTLFGVDGVLRDDRWERLPGEYHGSGCTLASAVAGALANTLDLGEAVRAAQEYTWQSLAHAFRPGKGQSIPDRFFWARHVDASAG
jgi:hydroxymethylpyrimidine/phosphomethylpyrimidine kinase